MHWRRWQEEFYLPPASSRAAKLRAKRDILSPWFLPQGTCQCVWVSAQLSQLCRTLPKRPISFSPHPEYWMVLHDEGVRRGWENAAWALGGHQMDVDSINDFTDASGKHSHSQWGSLACRSPQLVHRHHSSLCVLATHPRLTPTYTIAVSLCVPLRAPSMMSTCWMISELMQKPGLSLQIGKKHTNLSSQHYPRGSKWEAVSTCPGFAGSREAILS